MQNMPQYLGNIAVKGELGYSAMFCSDADQPDLVTIHWWPIEGPGQAVVFRLEQTEKNNYKLFPTSLIVTAACFYLCSKMLILRKYRAFPELCKSALTLGT
jgi:hypothetical protein